MMTAFEWNVVERLRPSDLRELAHLVELRDPEVQVRRAMPPERLEELSAMVFAGVDVPASWWQGLLAAHGPTCRELGQRLRAAQRCTLRELSRRHLTRPA
jgi:hypothetical protein